MVALRVALVGPEYEENLGLRYLHSAVKKAGHEPQIFDFRDRSQLDAIARTIVAFQADVVGLSMTFSRRAREFADLAAKLRTDGYAGHLTCGGHFASLHAERLLLDVPALDTVVVGEAEESLVELLEHLAAPGSVAGVCHRSPEGKVVAAMPRPVIDDLGTKPWPTRDAEPDTILGLRLADLVSGRGCWANCRFCSIGAWHRAIGGKRFRQRTVEDVADEMAALYSRGVRIFNFTDDNFFLPEPAQSRERFEALHRLLESKGVGHVGLQVKARPGSIDPQILTALKTLGVFRIFLGVESDSDRSLQALGRESTRAQNRKALDLIAEAGFHVTYNLLMFEPETTLEEVRAHAAFIEDHSAIPLGIYRTEVYGGTPLEEQLREQGRLQGDYFGYDYVITDPAAEKVFRMQHAVFGTRVFDLEKGMGPRSMALDHQLHLLEHFWPKKVSERLRARVRSQIVELNRNTAKVLRQMCDLAQRQPPLEEIEREVERWKAECEAFDATMDKQSKRLFVEMAGLARVKRAAVAGPVEYAVICALIFVAALLVVTFFGQNLRALFAASTELGGNESPNPAPRERKPIRNFGTNR